MIGKVWLFHSSSVLYMRIVICYWYPTFTLSGVQYKRVRSFKAFVQRHESSSLCDVIQPLPDRAKMLFWVPTPNELTHVATS